MFNPEQSQNAQTFVMKLGGDTSSVQPWLVGQLTIGAGAWAQVSMHELNARYAILTEKNEHRLKHRQKAIRKQLDQLPGSPTVEWVLQLNRRLQRLLGWGDVATTRADVERAAAGDLDELRLIMPEARLDGNDLSHLLALFDARGAPCALQVCDQTCQTPGVQLQWAQHPTRPLPFFVIDRVNDNEKVVWVRHEIGSEATLPEFATKFLTLFGDKLRGRGPQKSACLKLYARYNPDSQAKKECDLPPGDLMLFARVWDPGAPSRCLECSKEVCAGSYCNAKCRDAGLIFDCVACSLGQSCTFCNMKDAPHGHGRLDTALQENIAQLKRMRSATGLGSCRRDPEHVQEWVKRRRS